MTNDDKAAFARIVLGFAELRGKQLSREAIDLYWSAMQDWPLDQFQAAAQQLLKTSQFMPTPYDFEQLRKAGLMTAGEAFNKARQSIRSLWPSELAGFSSDDPLIDATVRACGGWEALGMMETAKIGFYERRFAEHYEAISDANQIRQALPFVEQPRINGPRKLIGAA